MWRDIGKPMRTVATRARTPSRSKAGCPRTSGAPRIAASHPLHLPSHRQDRVPKRALPLPPAASPRYLPQPLSHLLSEPRPHVAAQYHPIGPVQASLEFGYQDTPVRRPPRVQELEHDVGMRRLEPLAERFVEAPLGLVTSDEHH